MPHNLRVTTKEILEGKETVAEFLEGIEGPLDVKLHVNGDPEPTEDNPLPVSLRNLEFHDDATVTALCGACGKAMFGQWKSDEFGIDITLDHDFIHCNPNV